MQVWTQYVTMVQFIEYGCICKIGFHIITLEGLIQPRSCTKDWIDPPLQFPRPWIDPTLDFVYYIYVSNINN